jgi:signal transduction histidine kinase
MKKVPIEHKSYWILIAAAIVLAIGCILLRFQIHENDNYLFMQLLTAISGSRGLPHSAQPALDFFFVLAECGAAILIGYKLPAIPRSFAIMQLYIISMLLQWLMYSVVAFPGHPLSSACTLSLGGLLGYVFRRLNSREEKYKTQFYELSLRNRELQEARLLLVKQDEVERRMLAADLHDQVLNDLKALKQSIDGLESAPEQGHSERIQELLQRAMSEVREVMDNLCPSALEHLGLPAAIEDCCRRGAGRAGFKVRFKCSVDDVELEKLSVVEKSLLYRLVQESITNICKHAEATIVRANLSIEDRHLLIAIVDDGKGITKENKQSESRGLRYMRLRADLIGATVAWRGGDGDKGTIVEIRLEIANKNGHENTNS